MSIAASNEAIGAVSELLKVQLAAATGIGSVAIGRPEDASKAADGGGSFNLFLYRVAFDGQLRNWPLDAGQTPPVWLTLHYLLTAFDGNDSDSAAAHKLLSRGMLALNALNIIRPSAAITSLSSNPDPLRVSFDEADVDCSRRSCRGRTRSFASPRRFKFGR